jgi:hypothetical protein
MMVSLVAGKCAFGLQSLPGGIPFSGSRLQSPPACPHRKERARGGLAPISRRPGPAAATYVFPTAELDPETAAGEFPTTGSRPAAATCAFPTAGDPAEPLLQAHGPHGQGRGAHDHLADEDRDSIRRRLILRPVLGSPRPEGLPGACCPAESDALETC